VGVVADGTRPRALRVLYVGHTAVLGGCNDSLRYLIGSLPRGTVEPFVLCPDGPAVAQFRRVGATILRVDAVAMLLSIAGVPLRGRRLVDLSRTVWNLRFGPAIGRAIEHVKPDVVHLNESGMFQAACIAHRAGIPVVMHARAVADRGSVWVRHFSDWWMRRWVDRVIAIDESVRFSMREVNHCDVIYNPLDVAVLAARRPVPAPDGTTRVTFLTGLLPFKGIWDLLHAAVLLRNRRDIVFQIAGANRRPAEFHRSVVGRVAHIFGLAPDVETRLRRFVNEHSLSQVRLLGHVDRVADLLDRTDVLVFPSHLNGPGRSVFEAGARAIPSVVALTDRIEDVVENGVTGLIVPPRDPAALASAITRLADDPEYRRRLGETARTRYLVQFDPARIGALMLEVYKALDGRGISRAKGGGAT
jgi:glycosyltransferase involved in cell wall biosynthesis